MGRQLRIVDTEVLYHVGARGNNRGPIVWDRHDQDSFVEELAAAATKYKWDVFAWCLMTNHYHVVLGAPQDGLSAGFQEINGNYSRRTNRRYGRVDHLFKNRFFSVAVESEAYLVAALLYVARNPLAAGLCRRAEAWRYSSYRATVGIDRPPRWLVVDRVLRLFGPTPDQARAAYELMVHSGHLLVSDTLRERSPNDPTALTI